MVWFQEKKKPKVIIRESLSLFFPLYFYGHTIPVMNKLSPYSPTLYLRFFQKDRGIHRKLLLSNLEYMCWGDEENMFKWDIERAITLNMSTQK